MARQSLALAPFALLTVAALNAAPAWAAFPEGATAPPAADLRQRLADQVFQVSLASGMGMRLEFKNSGYVFIDLANGRRMTGEWKTEDGKLCSKIQQRDTDFYCGDARLHGGRVHVQRLDGEVIEYQPK